MPGFLFDANVWLALTLSKHPDHRRAQRQFSEKSGGTPVVFCRATQQSFLRLLTTPALQRIYGTEGFTNRHALDALNKIAGMDYVTFAQEAQSIEALWFRIANLPLAAPRMWMDAYLAAFAISAGLRLVTFDRDFAQFTRHGLDLLIP